MDRTSTGAAGVLFAPLLHGIQSARASRSMPVTVQVLMTPSCGHGLQTIRLVSEVIARFAPEIRVETVVVNDPVDAERHKFPGSPTVLINGVDIDPSAPAGTGVG